MYMLACIYNQCTKTKPHPPYIDWNMNIIKVQFLLEPLTFGEPIYVMECVYLHAHEIMGMGCTPTCSLPTRGEADSALPVMLACVSKGVVMMVGALRRKEIGHWKG